MSDHIQKTIADFRAKLERAESEVLRLKKTINDLCEMGGMPPVFAESDLDPRSSAGSIAFSSDAFYGKPLATCIKMILDRRKASGLGAATIDEIYQPLANHGYHFEGKEENRKQILRMALRKNVEFHKLPNNTYGMRDWYERIKAKNGSGEHEPDAKPEGSENANEED